MDYLTEKTQQYETAGWMITATGFAGYIPAFFWFKGGLDQAVCTNISRTCGIDLSPAQCREFKDRFTREADSRFSDSAASLLRNPRQISRQFSSLVERLKVLNPKMAAPFLSQEAAFFVGASTVQIDLTLLAQRAGINFFVALPFTVSLLWASTNIRRLLTMGYVARELALFGATNAAMCKAAREFRPAELEAEASANIQTDPETDEPFLVDGSSCQTGFGCLATYTGEGSAPVDTMFLIPLPSGLLTALLPSVAAESALESGAVFLNLAEAF
ncbi:MAG: hypothetical protein HY877_00300 [Deltaproteobacteria bacterium]|nr:hypothetical protein [Deltaproteobacteria bacterium]